MAAATGAAAHDLRADKRSSSSTGSTKSSASLRRGRAERRIELHAAPLNNNALALTTPLHHYRHVHGTCQSTARYMQCHDRYPQAPCLSPSLHIIIRRRGTGLLGRKNAKVLFLKRALFLFNPLNSISFLVFTVMLSPLPLGTAASCASPPRPPARVSRSSARQESTLDPGGKIVARRNLRRRRLS
jgi:hypothetical protein